jgi:DNA-binding transcriptional LysR family regulator
MVPTDAGERLMAYVRAGSEDGERVIEQVRGLADHSARRVRVACTEGFATGFMPEVMAGFRRSHPEALIERCCKAKRTWPSSTPWHRKKA